MGNFEREEDPYEERSRRIRDIYDTEEWYVSFVFGTVILGLAIYFIKIKRCQRFEWTIIICMFLKYAFFLLL